MSDYFRVTVEFVTSDKRIAVDRITPLCVAQANPETLLHDYMTAMAGLQVELERG